MTFPQQIIIVKEIDIAEALIKLRSDGIVHVHYKKDIIINAEIQGEMREIFKTIRHGKKSHYIFSSEPGVKFTHDVLKSSIDLNNEYAIATYAFIASSETSIMIANFYLKINKPKIPHKLFSNVDEAVEWLSTQKAELIEL